MFSIFLLVVVSAAIGAYRKPEPVARYQSAATLIVKPDRPAVVNISGAQPFYQQYFDESVDQRTQLQILTSRVILERLADSLGLLKPDSSATTEETVLEQIRQSIGVEQVPGTYLMRIVAFDHSPDRAIQLVNTMAEVYIEYNLQVKLSSARKTLGWLNEQIVGLRSKVQDSYGALLKYQNENQVLSLEMSPEIRSQKLAELTNAHDQSRQARTEAETRLAELRKWQQQNGGSGSEIIASIEDPVLEKLRGELMETEIERANLLQSYKDKHPKIKEVDVKIQSIYQNLEKSLDTVFKKLETNLSIARAKEETLAASLEQFKRDAIEMDAKRLEYSKLKREVSSTEELYNLLFKQLKETSITGDLEKNNIQILEPARTARNITPPLQRERIVGFGVIIGLLLGVGLAFLFEYFDKTIKNPEEVERYLGLPVLGTIPKIDRDYGKTYGRGSGASKKKQQYALEAEK